MFSQLRLGKIAHFSLKWIVVNCFCLGRTGPDLVQAGLTNTPHIANKLSDVDFFTRRTWPDLVRAGPAIFGFFV
jgi:hypothetical protein